MTILLQKKVLRWKINYLGKINLTMGITHAEETSLFIFFFYHEHHIYQWIVSCTFLKKKNKQKSEKKERIKLMAYFFLCVFLFVHYLV